MSLIPLFKRPSVPVVFPEPAQPAEPARLVEPLEDVLEELTRFGRPSLMCHDDMTWSCTVAMNTDASGADFRVRSDFKQTSPAAAAMQCRERVKAAVMSLGGVA